MFMWAQSSARRFASACSKRHNVSSRLLPSSSRMRYGILISATFCSNYSDISGHISIYRKPFLLLSDAFVSLVDFCRLLILIVVVVIAVASVMVLLLCATRNGFPTTTSHGIFR